MQVENKVKPERKNYLAKLFFGEIPLSITYWGFLVLANIIFAFINYIALNSISIIGEQRFILTIILSSEIIYSVFVSIAVVNSALKYKGLVLWPTLAILALIFGWLTFFANFLKSDIEKYSEQIQVLQKTLPQMIDKDTQLEIVNIDGQNVYYKYKLINYSKDQLDINNLSNLLRTNLLSKSCSDQGTLSLLKNGLIFNYIYKDKNDVDLFKVTITNSDCH
jgi:hypothetical protein